MAPVDATLQAQLWLAEGQVCPAADKRHLLE